MAQTDYDIIEKKDWRGDFNLPYGDFEKNLASSNGVYSEVDQRLVLAPPEAAFASPPMEFDEVQIGFSSPIELSGGIYFFGVIDGLNLQLYRIHGNSQLELVVADIDVDVGEGDVEEVYTTFVFQGNLCVNTDNGIYYCSLGGLATAANWKRSGDISETFAYQDGKVFITVANSDRIRYSTDLDLGFATFLYLPSSFSPGTLIIYRGVMYLLDRGNFYVVDNKNVNFLKSFLGNTKVVLYNGRMYAFVSFQNLMSVYIFENSEFRFLKSFLVGNATFTSQLRSSVEIKGDLYLLFRDGSIYVMDKEENFRQFVVLANQEDGYTAEHLAFFDNRLIVFWTVYDDDYDGEDKITHLDFDTFVSQGEFVTSNFRSRHQQAVFKQLYLLHAALPADTSVEVSAAYDDADFGMSPDVVNAADDSVLTVLDVQNQAFSLVRFKIVLKTTSATVSPAILGLRFLSKPLNLG